jgi:hypothetical protein
LPVLRKWRSKTATEAVSGVSERGLMVEVEKSGTARQGQASKSSDKTAVDWERMVG